MKALNTARSEMVNVITRQILATTLRKSVPSAADNNVSICADVLLYKEIPRNEWVVPLKVIAGDKKIFCYI